MIKEIEKVLYQGSVEGLLYKFSNNTEYYLEKRPDDFDFENLIQNEHYLTHVLDIPVKNYPTMLSLSFTSFNENANGESAHFYIESEGEIVSEDDFHLGMWISFDVYDYELKGSARAFMKLYLESFKKFGFDAQIDSEYDIINVSTPTISLEKNIYDHLIELYYLIQKVRSDVFDNIASNDINYQRAIEFPPEYHQAGLGILSFFGTYLRKNYPEEDATVSIKQDGLKVVMSIQTKDGKFETVEKALNEYGLIVSGNAAIQNYTNQQDLILELRDELRFAALRIESQKDRLVDKDRTIENQQQQIIQFMKILGNGIAQPQGNIEFNPIINVTTSLDSQVNLTQDFSSLLSTVSDLTNQLTQAPDAHSTLTRLQGALETVDGNSSQDEIKRSPIMTKLRQVLDELLNSESSLNKALEKAESGRALAAKLATQYNKIAKWCGLPQVPEELL